MWLFIHRPFEIWPWLGDLRIERVYMIITILYWGLFAEKTWTRNRFNVAVFLMVLAMVVPTLVSPHAGFGDLAVQSWFKLLVFYVLLVSSVRSTKELKILVTALVIIGGFYMLHSLYEFFCGRHMYRMGTIRMVGVNLSNGDPNGFAASVNYMIPMLLPVWLLVKNKWQKLALVGWFALAVICIFRTGSRTGFACLCFLMTGIAICSKNRWRWIAVLVIVAPLIWISLPEDLHNRFITLVDSSAGPESAKVSADSRFEFFELGMEIFKNNIIFGLGPDRFRHVNPAGLASHMVYTQALANHGLFGLVALLGFAYAYIGNYFDSRRIYVENKTDEDQKFLHYLTIATTIACLQLFFFGLGGHNFYRWTWLWYGAFSAIALRLQQDLRYGYYYASLQQPSWGNSQGYLKQV
jgi:hypothetical protein